MPSSAQCLFVFLHMEDIIEPLIMRLFLWKVEQWCRVKLTSFLRYGIGRATKATLDDIEILHRSSNFIIVNKKFDVLINSDDSNNKVNTIIQVSYVQ